jgi:hypothetical protein
MPSQRTDPATALAEKLLQALHAHGRPGMTAFPLTLQHLAQLADATAAPKTILSAAGPRKKTFTQHAVAVRNELQAPVALLEDVPQLVSSPRLLEFALAACRTAANHAFSPSELKAKVTTKLQKPFQEALQRQLQEEMLPPSLGWLHIKNTKELFALVDLHTGRKAVGKEAEPVPADVAPAPRPAEMPVDFGLLFDDAFRRLDREKGSHNFVSLVFLRQAVPVDRAVFDAELRRLRLAGRYTLSAAEGRHGLSSEEHDAGINEDGALLLYVSRRSP